MILLALLACREDPVDTGTAVVEEDFDFDDDGFDLADDCDDGDATVFPGAEETANLVDDDCDGLVDEDLVDVGDVVISEVMSQGTVEWFEVLNTTDATLDVVGWQLGPVTVDTSTLLKPNKRLLIADTQYFDEVEADLVVEGLDLGGAEGALSIVMDETELFAMTWDSSWDVVEGRSLSQDPDFTDNDANHWCAGKGQLDSGDRGTPGELNPLCWHLDHDGDGYSLDDGDCDDRDANASPQVEERWDGKDSDCDGQIDNMDLRDIDHVSVTSDGCIAGYLGNLGTLGDQLVVGGYYCGYVVDAGGLGDGVLTDQSAASFTGSYYYNYLGRVAPTSGDHDGDGTVDLLVGGSDYYYPDQQNAGAIWSGPVDGELSMDDALATFHSGTAYSLATGDVDGDGTDDVLYGNSSGYYGGSVGVFTGGVSGAVTVTDAPVWLTAESYYTGYFSNRMSVGDVDGDGYDDALVTASGDDEAGSDAGALFVFRGGPGFGTATDTDAWAKVVGKNGGDGLGWGGDPLVGDFGNGAGVVVPAATNNEVYLLENLGAGVTDAVDADLIIDGSRAPNLFGLGLAVGDFDGNGNDDIAIGAPDEDDTYDYYGTGDYEPGTVYWVFPDRLDAGRVAAEDAHRSLWSSDVDFFGQTLLALDINGDGTDDLVATGAYDTLIVVEM